MIKEISADLAKAIKDAYREGVEIGYLLSLEEGKDDMTFTYYRDKMAERKWHETKAKQATL